MHHRNDVYYYRKLIKNLKQTKKGCWEWQRARNKDGYGQTSYHGKHIGTHQLMLMLLGTYEKGLVADHICKNRACCNPDHLRMVTTAENILNEQSNNITAKNLRKTHCKNGHHFNTKNTAYDKTTGYRRCKRCKRERATKYRKEKGVKQSIHLASDLSQIQLFS